MAHITGWGDLKSSLRPRHFAEVAKEEKYHDEFKPKSGKLRNSAFQYQVGPIATQDHYWHPLGVIFISELNDPLNG